MKIKFNRPVWCDDVGGSVDTSKVYDLKEGYAKQVIKKGIAEEVKTKAKVEKVVEKPKAKNITKGNSTKKK